jgi:hypothetical protein
MMNSVSASGASGKTSAVTEARMAGVFYLLNIIAILLAIYLFRGIVSHDPAVTAANLLKHETAFRFGVALELLSTACSVAVAALFYELFRPVSRAVSLTAALFRVLACAIAVVGYLFQVAPLQILTTTMQFSGPDFAAIAIPLNRIRGAASDMVILMFGFHFVLIGYLIVRSGVLPRPLGLLVSVSGVMGMTFLAPPTANRIFPFIAGVGLVTELSLTIWLLVVGFNARRWREKFTAAENRF